MKYLGIDYGTKKIGLALSDDEGIMAYPHSVVKNDKTFLDTLDTMIHQEKIGGIVFGHSLNQKGEENPVMSEIHDLMAQLSFLHPVPMYLQQEAYTSGEARKGMPIEGKPRGNVANKKGGTKKKKGVVDDSAAAIILQRFLEKQK